MIYQQISGKAAKKISDRYLSLYANAESMLPSEVIDIDIKKIFKVGISRQKASYIKNIAHAFNTKIIDEKKFTNPVKKIGFRPLLRLFTNRYLIVYAEKIKE